MASKYDHIYDQLQEYREKNLYRELSITQIKDNSFYLRKKKVINLGSNDYLGLSQNTTILSKIRDSIKQVSPCSSRLISGTSINVIKLERILANHRSSENALNLSYRLHGKSRSPYNNIFQRTYYFQR